MEKIYRAVCLKDNTAWHSVGLSFTVKNPAEFFRALYSDFRHRDRSETSRFLERVLWRLHVNDIPAVDMRYERLYIGNEYKTTIYVISRLEGERQFQRKKLLERITVPCMPEPMFDEYIEGDF